MSRNIFHEIRYVRRQVIKSGLALFLSPSIIFLNYLVVQASLFLQFAAYDSLLLNCVIVCCWSAPWTWLYRHSKSVCLDSLLFPDSMMHHQISSYKSWIVERTANSSQYCDKLQKVLCQHINFLIHSYNFIWWRKWINLSLVAFEV